MKVLIFALISTFCIGSALAQTCGNSATLKVRADNFVSAQLFHSNNVAVGAAVVFSQAPDSLQWKNTYTTIFPVVQNGDKVRITVQNVGSVGGLKASLNFDGYETNSYSGNPDYSINCGLSVNVSSCVSNGIQNAVNFATIDGVNYYGPGTDILPLAAKWVWPSVDGLNPTLGKVVFEITLSCQAIVQVGNGCSFQYWEFLAIGYPWYHRSDLDSWCGPYPAVAGQTTNCFNGAGVIAPACTTTVYNLNGVLAGQGGIDWNLRCFLQCPLI